MLRLIQFGQKISLVWPEVILMDETGRLIAPTELLARFADDHQLRVLVVSSMDYLIHMADRQEVLVTCATQVINLKSDSHNKFLKEKGGYHPVHCQGQAGKPVQFIRSIFNLFLF